MVAKHLVDKKEFQIGDLVLKWDKAHEEKENTQSFNIFGWYHS
jgi:hypothetical protein